MFLFKLKILLLLLQIKNKTEGTITFYDSVSGKPLFIAPKGRTWKEFIDESNKHGWPSFRDEEVNMMCTLLI